jgi:hypothetical protein
MGCCAQRQAVSTHFRISCEALDRASRDDGLTTSILAIAGAIADAFRAGGKVLIAGNGGSAADAQHIAGEMLSRMNYDRNPLPAIALTTDTSVLTAVGNDYGFDHVFERQVRGLGRRGDVFIAITAWRRPRPRLLSFSRSTSWRRMRSAASSRRRCFRGRTHQADPAGCGRTSARASGRADRAPEQISC